MEKTEILNVFRKTIEKPLNSYTERWVSDGGKVAGYYCTLIPGEIFTAAGMMPYRIRGAGSEDTAHADVYLSSQLCTFVRHTVNLALEHQFDFLDGIVAMNGCDQARRAYDVWEKKTKIPFRRILSIPRSQKEDLISWYMDELKNLITALEEHFSLKIDPESLLNAIKLHNRARKNLTRLNEMRMASQPPITGAEASAVSIAAHVMPLKDFNELIEGLLKTLDDENEGVGQYRVRLIVSGGELDEPEFVQAIEDQGGLVVYDDTCFGARFYEELVSEEGDPLTQIAERYFYRMPCARTEDSFPMRYENLKKASAKFQADGIIVQRINHCLINAGHSLLFNIKAKGGEMPTLILDREYLTRGYGQVKTRVQAFVERLESKLQEEAV